MIHKVTHQYQPTNTSCGPTAASMLLSHYGSSITPKEAITLLENDTPDNLEGKFIQKRDLAILYAAAEATQ